MTDLPRLTGEPTVDNAPTAKRPWRTPVVIESTLPKTEKPPYASEVEFPFTFAITAAGPS